MRRGVTWSLLVWLLFASAPSGAAGGDLRSSGPIDGVTETAGSRHFDLGLDREVEPRFRLFGTRDGGTAMSPTSPAATAGSSGTTLLTASLVYSVEEHPVPDDLRINLKPRTWGDLSGWEKLGVVASYAGTVAGAAYLVSRVVD